MILKGPDGAQRVADVTPAQWANVHRMVDAGMLKPPAGTPAWEWGDESVFEIVDPKAIVARWRMRVADSLAVLDHSANSMRQDAKTPKAKAKALKVAARLRKLRRDFGLAGEK